MAIGPLELLVIGFPEERFTGEILPELEALIERDVISVVDGVLIRKAQDGSVTYLDFDEIGVDDDLRALAQLIDELKDLIGEDDVDELAAQMPPGSAAAALLFEHTWAIGFRDAVVAAGGETIADLRIPGLVVEEVLNATVEGSAS